MRRPGSCWRRNSATSSPWAQTGGWTRTAPSPSAAPRPGGRCSGRRTSAASPPTRLRCCPPTSARPQREPWARPGSLSASYSRKARVRAVPGPTVSRCGPTPASAGLQVTSLGRCFQAPRGCCCCSPGGERPNRAAPTEPSHQPRRQRPARLASPRLATPAAGTEPHGLDGAARTEGAGCQPARPSPASPLSTL